MDRLECTASQAGQGLCCPHTESLNITENTSGAWYNGLMTYVDRLECTASQAGQGLCCPLTESLNIVENTVLIWKAAKRVCVFFFVFFFLFFFFCFFFCCCCFFFFFFFFFCLFLFCCCFIWTQDWYNGLIILSFWEYLLWALWTNYSSHRHQWGPISLWQCIMHVIMIDWLIVLGFNDTSTLEGHFVSSPREREKRDRRESRGDEREGQGRKRNRNKSEETEEIKTFPLYPYPLQG